MSFHMNPNMEPNDQDQVIRGKRSKRSRQSIIITTTTTSSSSCGASSVENSVEDEDMANCLIMLAQSGSFEKPNFMVEKPGFYLYECKTCNRSFSSFQALGGHRASHKKPKSDQEKKVVMSIDLENKENAQQKRKINPVSQLISLHDSKTKVHECSICGTEFGSGQALGGHMRRHRNTNTTTNSTTSQTNVVNNDEKARNVLQLDLNLPAPEDNHRDSKFHFSYSCQAPALVDCQY